MKKLSIFLLLLSLVTTSISFAFGQGRPRRVGNPQGVPPTTAPEPQPQTTTPQAPTKPPVLGGANYPNNRKPEQPQGEQAPAGPEEVDAGDVIRVSTTLVSIPVSVMDRDGRYVPNLLKDDFRIWEDGVEQEVAFFQSVDKAFSVVLMLDTSPRSEEHTSELQSPCNLVCRLLLEKKQ